jgi:hypothetical protein
MRIPAEGTRVAFMKNSTVYVSKGSNDRVPTP